MVGNGVVPFPCGSGRGKTFSKIRNIVIFGSERGKTLFQTRETVQKREKEEKKKRKKKPPGSGRRKMFSQTRNIVIFGSGREKTSFQTREVNEKKEMTVEERSTDSDRGIQKIVGNQMLNHAGV
ncbi:MAG: hypothetical protein ACLVBT_02580 [Roseburia hominis]|uniref:hypothetical protein n=1 Tax=Roseburia hominis TaxID=301301 RepID=UPI002673834E|nr:hypothetical protein [Roseburia hominis]